MGHKKQLSEKTLQVINLSDTQLVISRGPETGIYLPYIKPKYQIQKVKVAVDFLIRELRTD